MDNYKLEYIGIKSPIIKLHEKVLDVFCSLLENEYQQVLESNDLIVIASKVVAMEQGRVVDLKKVSASPKAVELSLKAKLKPEFVELVLQESDIVIGAVPGALLTLRKGDVQANAGVDKSNAGIEKAILLPSDPDNYAYNFKINIEKRLGLGNIGIIIADSATRPLRLGTVGLAIGSGGFPAIVDTRGDNDLFGYKMTITLRNFADNIASGANVIMGESNESIPFVIVKGFNKLVQNYNWKDRSITDLRIDTKNCLYFGNLKYEAQ